MIEQAFRSARVVRRLRSTLLGPAFDDLVAYLSDRGHAVGTIQVYVQAVEHFDRWLRRSRRGVVSIDEAVVERFLRDHLPRCRCPTPCGTTVHQCRAALRHLLIVLRRAGHVPPRAGRKLSPAERLVRTFEAHLRDDRGAAPVTCKYSGFYAREFLEHRFRGGDLKLAHLGSAAVMAFLTARVGRWSPGSMQVAASSLRRFFRYLQMIGKADARLVQAVPAVASWRLASVPRALTDRQVAAVLAAFDRSTRIGARGYATTICMTHLGLRACEVAALTLDDIDWRAGTITVPATKTRRADQLPLPAPVARAILAYVRRARPSSTTRQLFVRHKTPAGTHAGPGIVRVAVHKAGARSGLSAGVVTPSVLRHTVATRLLRSGATMKEVADVLRHRSIDTAAIYAKVDIVALRDVAAPWPRRAR